MSTDNVIIDYDLPDDINDVAKVDSIVSSVMPDAIIHAAAIADLNESASNYKKNFDVNVCGTNNIAAAANKYKVPLHYISTCCAYGNNQPATVKTSLEPTENYAASKSAGEFIVRQYGNDYVIMRLPTMYGPGMRKELFIYQLIDAAFTSKIVSVYGDGRQARQYGYVADVASRILWYVVNKKTGVYNLNSQESVSVRDIIYEIQEITGKQIRFKTAGGRKGEIFNQQIEPSLSGGFTTFREGIIKTISWYCKQNGAKYTNG